MVCLLQIWLKWIEWFPSQRAYRHSCHVILYKNKFQVFYNKYTFSNLKYAYMWERNYSADGILFNGKRTVVSVYKKTIAYWKIN